MDSTKLSSRAAKATIGSVLLLAGLGPVSPVYGGEASFDLQLGASYIDNLFLDTSPDEVDDIVYRASPTLKFTHDSLHWDADLDYRLEWFEYDDLGSSRTFHTYSGTLTAKALRESLALELGAQRSQIISDPDENIPPGRLPQSGNLNDFDQYWVNPRLNRQLGDRTTVDVSYRFTRNQFSEATAQENDDHSASFSLDNYRVGSGLTWALSYDWRRTEYEISAPWEYQIAKGELGVWINSNTRVFAAGGQESPWDDPFTPSFEDSFWEAGFAYTAGEKIRMEFAAGEREFGSSWRGSVDYSFRRGSTTFSYVETPSTTGFRRGGQRIILDPDDPDSSDDFISRPGDAERYLSKRLQWNLDLNLRRTSVGLVLFDEERTGRVTSSGEPREEQNQTGVTARVSWEVGKRTSIAATGGLVTRETTPGRETDLTRASASASYKLGSRTRLSLAYSYADEQPSAPDAARDYVVNTVSLFLTFGLL